jgi:hypothetical protein
MLHGWRFVLVSCAAACILAALDCSVPAAEDAQPAASGEAPAQPAEKHQLAFKFRLGQIVRQEISHESEIKTHKNQDTETAKNSSHLKRHYKVVAADEKTGAGDLELTIDWVHMRAEFETAGKTHPPVEFQSDDPKKQPVQFGDVKASVGRSRATIRFSPTGAPVKVVSGTIPQLPSGPGSEAKGISGSPLSDGSLEAYLIPLPEKPVAVGESWKDPFDVILRDDAKNLVKVAIQRVYKLVEVKDGRAVIELRTAILSPITNGAVEAQLIQREISGKIVFDIEQGLIISRETNIDKTIVNAVGANSSMRAVSTYREKLVGVESIADRQTETASDATSKK